jgi:hypothetical protein
MTEQTPSIFDLRDIVVPEPVGFWPPAAGVWVLVGVAGCALALLIWRGYLVWKSGAYRRAGLARLAQIEGQLASPGSEVAALRELSDLLKRVALAAFPRKQVAPLYGESWLRFLEHTCDSCTFTVGPGKLLNSVTSTGQEALHVNADHGRELIDFARRWIKGHHALKNPDVRNQNSE